MKRAFQSLWLISLLLMALACGGGGGNALTSETPEITAQPGSSSVTSVESHPGKAKVLIDLADFSSSARTKALGQYSEVDKVFASVTDGDGNALMSDVELVHVSGTFL